VAGQPVLGLSVDGAGQVVHLVAQPVQGAVEVALDWARRYDLMQQHTAQHLLTALCLARFELPTTAFHLGDERSDIELGTPDLPAERLEAIEETINREIRAARPIRQRLVSRQEMAQLPVRSRRLPEVLDGPVRLIEIEGLDLNTCGGTHLASTAEIQAVKLLGTERLRGGTRLFFQAGGRVLKALGLALSGEERLKELLSCGTAEQPARVQRLLDEAREGERARRIMQRELAELLGAQLAREPNDLACLHRPEGDMEFLLALAGAARKNRPGLVLLLSCGEREGMFLLAGPEEKVARLGPRVAEALEGRGGGKRGIFQGRATRLDRLPEAQTIVQAG
jgi:Ser-tRNA(Ala) deacylase AlaX